MCIVLLILKITDILERTGFKDETFMSSDISFDDLLRILKGEFICLLYRVSMSHALNRSVAHCFGFTFQVSFCFRICI